MNFCNHKQHYQHPQKPTFLLSFIINIQPKFSFIFLFMLISIGSLVSFLIMSYLKKPICQGRWSTKENELFNSILLSGSNNWYEISAAVMTRTPAQCRAHYKKSQISSRIRSIKEKALIKPINPINSILIQPQDEKSLQFSLATAESTPEIDEKIVFEIQKTQDTSKFQDVFDYEMFFLVSESSSEEIYDYVNF